MRERVPQAGLSQHPGPCTLGLVLSWSQDPAQPFHPMQCLAAMLGIPMGPVPPWPSITPFSGQGPPPFCAK